MDQVTKRDVLALADRLGGDEYGWSVCSVSGPLGGSGFSLVGIPFDDPSLPIKVAIAWLGGTERPAVAAELGEVVEEGDQSMLIIEVQPLQCLCPNCRG